MDYMSYTPKHGGGQKKASQTDKTAVESKSANTAPARPKADVLTKTLVIVLLIFFVAGIIVAAIFLFKPAAPQTDDDNTVATYAYDQSSTAAATSAYSGSYTSSNPVLQYSGGEIPTSGARHDVNVIADGGVDAMEIIGTWHVDKWTSYVFDGYGRGVMLTSNDNYTFAYSAQDGLLTVDYDNDKGMDTEYTYVLNGDKLILKRGNNEYKLTRELEQEQTQEPSQGQTQGSD